MTATNNPLSGRTGPGEHTPDPTVTPACDNHPNRPATDIGYAANLCDECVKSNVAGIMRRMAARTGPTFDL